MPNKTKSFKSFETWWWVNMTEATLDRIPEILETKWSDDNILFSNPTSEDIKKSIIGKVKLIIPNL